MLDLPAPPRFPWPDDFPPIVAHAEYGVMRTHSAYRAAKDGQSDEAAQSLVYDLIIDKSINQLIDIIGKKMIRIVGVHAEEATGRNKIPLAYAETLSHVLSQPTDPGIVQSSVANHGGAPSIYHRMASQPWFDGNVEKGANYLIVDDMCTAGGTLANLRGFIESNGGTVVAVSVLARKNISEISYISLAPGMAQRLKYKHVSLDTFWAEEFGYGLECLTNGEAGHLHSAPSVDTIRNRLAEARRDIDFDRDEGADNAAVPPTGGDDNETDENGP